VTLTTRRNRKQNGNFGNVPSVRSFHPCLSAGAAICDADNQKKPEAIPQSDKSCKHPRSITPMPARLLVGGHDHPTLLLIINHLREIKRRK
jgi:hypothetical protein